MIYINFHSKRPLLIFILLLLFSCSKPSNENTTEDIPENVSAAQDAKNQFELEKQYGDYLIRVIQKNSNEDFTLTVLKNEEVVLADTQLRDVVDRFVVRDLDNDSLLEVYIISRGGNGGFESIDMYEIGGGELNPGDIGKLYGAHDFYFTENRLIHQQWLINGDGCCDNIGHEFIYFKLKNNTFVFDNKAVWKHRDGEAKNETRF